MVHMSTSTTIAGFTVIPISYSAGATHFVYARAHTNSSKSPKISAFPDGRTLFLVNVPPDATEREITQFFRYCGTIEKVQFEERDFEEEEELAESSEGEENSEVEGDEDSIPKEHPRKRRKSMKGRQIQTPKVVPLPTIPLRTFRKTGQICHVVFLDATSLKPALLPSQKPRAWPADGEMPSGLAHYTALYNALRPPLDVVREHAYTAVALYQQQLENSKQKSKYRKGEAIVDQDGFTLVTRGGAYGKTLGGGVGVANKKFVSKGGPGKRTRKKEKKEKDGFYAFQIHEKNRKGNVKDCFMFCD
jgi:ribosomal RNA-processing protein 7